MIQVKTVIRYGQPVFEVRRYAPNFKSSVMLLETADYNDAVEVKNFLEARSTAAVPAADPNQLEIPTANPKSNGK